LRLTTSALPLLKFLLLSCRLPKFTDSELQEEDLLGLGKFVSELMITRGQHATSIANYEATLSQWLHAQVLILLNQYQLTMQAFVFEALETLQVVDVPFRRLLKKYASTYKNGLILLERLGSLTPAFKYDICPTVGCDVIYRVELRDSVVCPKCSKPR
jgi:hypothetical protein